MTLPALLLTMAALPRSVVVETWFHDREAGIDERVVERLVFAPGEESDVVVVRNLEKTILGQVVLPVPAGTAGTRFVGRIAPDGTWVQAPSDVEPHELVRMTRLLFPPVRPGDARSWSVVLPAVPKTEVPQASYAMAQEAGRVRATFKESSERGMTATGWLEFDEHGRWTEMRWQGAGARLPHGEGTPLAFELTAKASYKD